MKNEYLSRERLPDNEICSNLFSAKTVDILFADVQD